MSELQEYKQHVIERLAALSPYLAQSATGNFQEELAIPEEEDEFSELIIGIKLMVEDFQRIHMERKTNIENLEEKNTQLEAFNKMAIDREQRMVKLKQEVNALCEELGREPVYDLSFLTEV